MRWYFEVISTIASFREKQHFVHTRQINKAITEAAHHFGSQQSQLEGKSPFITLRNVESTWERHGNI